MIFIIQIILTVVAWRNGWKIKALLPLLILVGIAFSVGFFIGMVGGNESDAYLIGTLLDIATIAVLGIMCFKSPIAEVDEGEDKTTKLD